MPAKVVDVSSVPETPAKKQVGFGPDPGVEGSPPGSRQGSRQENDGGGGSRPMGTRQSQFGFGEDVDEIKQKIRKTTLEKQVPPYNVYDHYSANGFFPQLAQNPYFENVTLGVIVVNALWISIDTDWNKADTLLDAHPIFVLFDSMFFAYFSAELFVRFMAFRRKCDCLKDGWFVFDSTLVALYAFDPFIITVMAAASGGGGIDLPTSILRLFRLARLSRLVRMLRSLPELMIMIKGMVTAATTVSYTLGLLVLVTYIFGIALTQLAPESPGDIKQNLFKTVPLSMYSLFIYGTFVDNLADFFNAVRAESTPCLVLITLYVVLASLTVMNMLIGVLCEVISEVAANEKEAMMQDKVHEKFDNIVKKLDKDDNGKLSWYEFQQIMAEPEAIKALEQVKIDPIGMIDFAEDFFHEEGQPKELDFEEFMEMLLDLRGGLPATLKDVMKLGKRFNAKTYEVGCHWEGIESKLDQALLERGIQPRPSSNQSQRSRTQ